MKSEAACAQFLDELLARGKQSPQLVAHLASCPDCRAAADTVKGLRGRPSAYPEGSFGSLKEKVLASCLPVAVAAGAGATAGAAASGGLTGVAKTAVTLLVPLVVAAGLVFAVFHHGISDVTPPTTGNPAVVRAPALASSPVALPAKTASVASPLPPVHGGETGEPVLPSDQE